MVKVTGRFNKFSHVVLLTRPDVEPSKMLMNRMVRKNLNVNVGDVVTLSTAMDLKEAKRIQFAPFEEDLQDYNGDVFETHI